MFFPSSLETIIICERDHFWQAEFAGSIAVV
jgi:hypothetical protein